MNLKKITAAALAAAVAATAFSACSAPSPSQNSEQVSIWAWDETFNIAAVNQAKALYQKDHPNVDIQVETIPQDDIVKKLHTSLSSGQTSGLPSIVLIEDYKAQNFLTAYPDAFEPLDDIVNTTDYLDYKFGVNTHNNHIYGVPFDSGVCGLFYRIDYLEQAGYTEQDLNNITWERYTEIGKDVKQKTGHAMLTLDGSDLGQIRMMMQSAGEWYVEPDGKTVNIKDNQALKDAITIYKGMIDAGIADQVSGWDSFVSAFNSGSVASVPTGCWISSSVQQAADQSGKWRIAPLPRMGSNSSSVNASSMGGGGWYVLKGVGNTQAAKDFLQQTFASSTQLAGSLAKDIGLVSALKGASDTEAYQAPNEFYGGETVFENFSEWAEQVPTVNYGIDTYEIEEIVTQAVASILKGGDMDAALANAQSQAEGVIKQH